MTDVRLNLDLDGVLADFDRHYAVTFGVRPDRVADNVDWKAVRAVPGFYRDMPPLPDAMALWAFARPLGARVITGVPSSVPEAPDNKRTWVAKHLGADVEVICCRSRDKARHCQPGDVLVDDWAKYRDLWLLAGGRWVMHTSAAQSIAELRWMGIGAVRP